MMELMMGVAIKGAGLLAIASVAAWVLRGSSAATRHFVWAVCAMALVLLPALVAFTPNLRVLPGRSAIDHERIPGSAVQAATAAAAHVSLVREEPVAASPTLETPVRASVVGPSFPNISRDAVLMTVWLAGMLLILASIGVGFLRVRQIARRSHRLESGPLRANVERVTQEMNVRRVVALIGSEFAMPMTWGIVSPKLLLPSAAHNWPIAKLEAVLRHELAHVRRRDSFWQLVGETACAMNWFNPLAWHAVRQMRLEREHACDDEVLMAGSRPSDYAFELLDVARSLRPARATSLAAIAMAQPRQLEGRLLAVLDEGRERRRPARKWLLWAAACAVVLPIAALAPRLATAIPTEASIHTEEATPRRSEGTRRVTRASGPREKAPLQASFVAPRTIVQAQERCLGEDVRNVHMRSDSDRNDYQETSWETKSCKGKLITRGAVRIAGDMSRIESISSGGEFRLTEDDDRNERELLVEPDNGRLTYTYKVNGRTTPWNGEGQKWLSDVLMYMARSTGFAADERVDYLLRQGGHDAVLREIEAMRSDWVQRQYFQKLIAKTQLNAGGLENVLRVASRTLDSDHEMTELLVFVAKKYEFTDGVRRAYLDAANTLNSSYEHGRALSVVLAKGGLSSENVAAVLASSQSLSSDYERSQLLLGVASRYKLDPRMRAAFLQSASALGSDYEKGRVFGALLDQGMAKGAETAEILNAVGTITSDYERGKLLRRLTGSDLSDPQTQQAYLKLISRMSSDYEVRQTLQALMAKQKLTSNGVDLVLTAADHIESDYEQASLLTMVVRDYTLTSAQKASVRKAIDRLDSDHERGKLSSLLMKQMD